MIQFPLVSIIITTFNRVKFLERAVKSAQSQNYRNIEIIISDNASSDSTEIRCLEWASKDPRVKYFKNSKNIGSINNHKVAFLEHANGDWVVFVSDDDFLTNQNFISNGMAQIYDLGGDVAFYQTGVEVFNEMKNESISSFPKIENDTQIFQPTKYFLEYFNILFFSFTTTILNRKQIINEKLVEQRFRLDVELLLIMSLSKNAVLTKEINGVYTIHSNQLFASSAFLKYISIFKCYIYSAEYALKGKFLDYSKVKVWINTAKEYYYLNIVGWVTNLMNKNISSSFLVITNRRLNTLLDMSNIVDNTYYLWITKDFHKDSKIKYHQIYFKGILYDITWYMYSNFNIKKLLLNFKN
jgi:glycosyltransferase involved in cell wall biosynthesis